MRTIWFSFLFAFVHGSLSAASSKGDVYVFLSSRCPCSLSHEGEIKSLAREYMAKGFRFKGVHSNSDEREPRDIEHFEAKNWPFEIVSDFDAKLANQFGALKTPHVFVVSETGESIYFGGVSDSRVFNSSGTNYLREVLEDLDRGHTLRWKKSLAVGCTIRREQ